MARPKKAVTTTSTKAPTTVKLTMNQLEILQAISELISEGRRPLYNFEPENLAAAGFMAGKSYVHINEADDMLTDLLNDISPESDLEI